MATPPNELDRIQADLVRAIATPARLSVVRLLGDGPLEVGQIAQALGLSPVLTSQNLAAMRAVGLVEATRDGRSIRYALTDPDIIVACDLMRAVIVRRVTALATVAAAADPRTPDAGPAKRQVATA
jgi:DNA-binding transcriptional ArsR family regulator